MLLGSIDVEKAVEIGEKAFKPGLLAEANQNILYIDEVNLLPDHITDSILDAAASGWNTVEREGISVSHPSRFILIGTMNPEEGELRPQLSDRFSLHITVEGIYDVEQRVEIIKRNLEFNENPAIYLEKWSMEQDELRTKILDARKKLKEITVSTNLLRAVALGCIELHVDGHRPDIATIRAAKALASLSNRKEVTKEDIMQVIVMAVGHRSRGFGFEEPARPSEIRETFSRILEMG